MTKTGLKEECGVVGIYAHPDAANLVYLSLYALQHRGQEACGIVTLDEDNKFRSHKSFGLVGDAFSKSQLDVLKGARAIGHNRYSTHGGRSLQNIQPFTFNSSLGPLAIAHNGNLTNSKELRDRLESEGSIFQSTSDTEVFMHLFARCKANSFLERISEVMSQVRGAYSLVILSKDELFAVRDPYGFRPLVIGKKDYAHVVASETCALDLIDAQYIREVEAGEIVSISNKGISSYFPEHLKVAKKAFCSFEPIYFARPDSFLFGERTYEIRKNLGRQLAIEDLPEADVVIAVPDSGVPMAMGYAAEANLPYEVGLVRNHYVGRTFIEPTQAIRDFGVKLKLNPVSSVIKDKRVVVVDDSLVRGTTSIKILRMIRNAGAKEIHMRIGSPPITHSCYFGVDTPARDQLLAAQKSVDEMLKFIGADSLAFLSREGLSRVLGEGSKDRYCFGCFGVPYREDPCTEILPQPTDPNGPGLRAKS